MHDLVHFTFRYWELGTREITECDHLREFTTKNWLIESKCFEGIAVEVDPGVKSSHSEKSEKIWFEVYENSQEVQEICNWYSRTNRKGYIRLFFYHKMRKGPYGNKWTTQFVTLHREEVRKLEEYHLSLRQESYNDSAWALVQRYRKW